MPYRMKTLAGATPAALAEEVRAELDAAFSANPSWTKVTSGYTGNSTYNFIDVWRNSGANSGGYPWYVVVARYTSGSFTYLGGALEYDSGTNIAKKAMRISMGFVNAEGYPVTASGGSTEQDFQLSAFTHTMNAAFGNLGGGTAIPTTQPATGDWCRTLVTDQVVWQGYGKVTSLSYCHGVGTYQNLHSTTSDLKPLAFIATTIGSVGAGTVWRDPASTEVTYGYTADYWASSARWANCSISGAIGEVGGITDLHVGGPIGSRMMIVRTGSNNKDSVATNIATRGGLVGLVPDDFLLFDRAAGVQIGDTITVGGKVYVSVDSPFASIGLFVNTQPTS